MNNQWTNALPTGICVQIYKDSLKRGELDTLVRDCRASGVDYVAIHGAVSVDDREILSRHHMRYALAFGLDGKSTGVEKGRRVADAIAENPNAKFTLLDAEGQWDTNTGPTDTTTPAHALAMGSTIRAAHPNALLIDQPWFAIQSHGDERQTPEAIDSGGTFKGFPSDEFASFIDARCPQVYFRNFHGTDAYAKVLAWHRRDWAQHEASLERAQLVRPRSMTLQGYGHTERPQDFINALFTPECADALVVLWWDAQYRSQWELLMTLIKAHKSTVTAAGIPAMQRAIKAKDDGVFGPDSVAKFAAWLKTPRC